ncbi:MAG TPA: DMT family transporter, partial [Candidatus Binatia bacterium]|nr:DMT family transporter [Candidatus Binatia bacterium]
MSHPSKDMDLKGAAVAVLISILWGANTVVIKMGLEEAPPLRLACMRFVVGGGVICLWAWATGRFAGFRVEPAEWRPLVFLGLLFSVQMAATNVGTWLTSAAHASVLLNLYAVHTVVLAH